MSEDKEIVQRAKKYVLNIYQNADESLVMHSFYHSREIMQVCLEITEEEEFPEKQTEELLIAAWFLFTGFTRNYESAFSESVEICKGFLENEGYPTDRTEKVLELIRSASPDRKPATDLEKYLHDAQWSFLGRKRFFRMAELWRIEIQKQTGEKQPPDKWNKKMKDLLVNHQFYSKWAIERYSDRKNKNILKQISNITDTKKKTRRQKTGKDFGRGIDTLYRNTLRGHLDLSSIADGKANMMISINALILSILITAGSATISISQLRIEENLQFIVPTLILMVSSLGAIIFAVLSAIPRYGNDEFKLEDVKDHNISMLFFNNFLNLKQEDFVDYLDDLKRDQNLLYDDLAKDVYNLGKALKKKYSLLNIAYKLFVIGIALSFIAFLTLLLVYGF